jgi:ammonia channel protein AmtB
MVIHISAGFSALAAVLYLGKRQGYPETAMQPNNLVMTLIGAGLLWVGWFGFNAGSTVQSGLDTARALTMTQISASSGALTWIVIEAIRFKKATSLGFASGILAGLVVITPAAGVVHPAGAMCLGAISSLACYVALNAKVKFGYDDSLDVVHETLIAAEITRITVSRCTGHGRAQGDAGLYRGQEITPNLIPKVRLDVAVNDNFVEAAVSAIQSAGRTGEIGDGKIIVTPIDEIYRIRTGESGSETI